MPRKKESRWETFIASDGKPVDFPTNWIDILDGFKYKPKPREEFAHLKRDLQAGDMIDLWVNPKPFKNNRKVIVTEQMLELWNDIHGDELRQYVRVLSGPAGVGKSYLSYFLAARAYAEGWPILYISDAGDLDKGNEQETAMELIKRFLALKKDILTAAELDLLVSDYYATIDVSRHAIGVIFEKLLQQAEQKSLLLVDEHGELFQRTPTIPEQYKSLYHLQSLSLRRFSQLLCNFHWNCTCQPRWIITGYQGKSKGPHQLRTTRAVSSSLPSTMSKPKYLKWTLNKSPEKEHDFLYKVKWKGYGEEMKNPHLLAKKGNYCRGAHRIQNPKRRKSKE
ncbi:hypothetical protein BGZ65_007694 [Modicella reniformis]|uniref:Uncharacterized protein n=1 Tax=Modicella reniformis TaxID=1440133 RepID=A0A9P6J4T0_9FUNG|nr:hypothetical protein BGZ65_007694 [Modicella reniformis]